MLFNLFTLLFSSFLFAGTLADGQWHPDNCGERPELPEVDTSNAFAYSSSVHTVVEWQTATKAFNECLVKEANSDTASIIKAAKEEQERSRTILEKINTEAAQLNLSTEEDE